jgi:predicted nucleic acid-binding protein
MRAASRTCFTARTRRCGRLAAVIRGGVADKPLSAAEADRRMAFLRDESGFSFCCYELRSWPMIHVGLSTPAFPRRRTYDLVLAVTFKSNGVTEFYTRNVVDFRDAGFTRVVNPID